MASFDGHSEIWLLQHPSSRYGVIPQMTCEIAQGLQSLPYGRAAIVYERGSSEYKKALEQLHWQEDSTLLCRFGINQILPHDIVYDLYGVPYVFYALDAMSHFPELDECREHHTFVASFVDADSKDMYEKRYKRDAHWIPHAISVEEVRNKIHATHIKHTIASYDDRPYDIVICGSWIDYESEELVWKNNFSKSSYNKLLDIAHQVLIDDDSSNHIPYFFQLLEEDKEIQKQIEHMFADAHDKEMQLCNSLERYIRGKDRKQLCDKLAGFSGKVMLLSHAADIEKWKESLIPHCCNIDFVADVPYQNTWEFFSLSKCVINSVPTIKKGIHERFLAALYCGAKIITTPNILLPKEAFAQEAIQDIRQVKNVQQIADFIKKPYSSSQAAMAWVEEHHSWEKRLIEIWPNIEKEIHLIKAKRCASTL